MIQLTYTPCKPSLLSLPIPLQFPSLFPYSPQWWSPPYHRPCSSLCTFLLACCPCKRSRIMIKIRLTNRLAFPGVSRNPDQDSSKFPIHSGNLPDLNWFLPEKSKTHFNNIAPPAIVAIALALSTTLLDMKENRPDIVFIYYNQDF